MRLYAGTGPSLADALASLAEACVRDRRDPDLSMLTQDTLTDLTGTAVLYRVEVDTHSMEP